MKSERNSPALAVLMAISIGHLLNDGTQAILPSIYPLIKGPLGLDYVHIGLITLTFQLAASLLQPLVGFVTDRHPRPFSLATGMFSSLVGVVLLSFAASFGQLLAASALVGFGSSVFHPEASRVARMASAGQHGLAQSIFQVGGNAGTFLGPLLVGIVLSKGHLGRIAFFALIPVAGICVLLGVGRWYRDRLAHLDAKRRNGHLEHHASLPRPQLIAAIAVLAALIFSKFFYLSSINTYYTFFLIHKFHLSDRAAIFHLSYFAAGIVAGTLVGGPVGDRIGRKQVIWFSILGVAPFTLLLPHVGLQICSVLTVVIGIILSSAFPAILVYAQELMPGQIGLVTGIFFGFAFGMGALGSALLGILADAKGLDYMFNLCSLLPLIGLLAAFLPRDRSRRPV